MNLSKKKIALFFLTLGLLTWFLYPRALFLGFIYEGLTELKQSEKYYKEYLEQTPFNKFATLRLASLYERMGEPDEATLLLRKLYEHRKSDWQVTDKYLNHLEDTHDAEALQKARLDVAHYWMGQPRYARRKVDEILYDTYLYARWKQKDDEAYNILFDLMQAAPDPKPYVEEALNLDRGLQKTEKLEGIFTKRIAENPKDIDARNSLAEVYMVMGKFAEAMKVIDAGLKLKPDQLDFMKTRVYLDQKLGDKRQAIMDIQTLLSSKKIDTDERTDFTDELASLYSETGKKEKALALYRGLLRQYPEDPKRWLNVISLLSDMKRPDEAIVLLKHYQAKFGSDAVQQKLLADIYLYEKKEVSELPFYKAYVMESRQIDFAEGVGYLLLDNDQTAEAIVWLEFANDLFKNNPKIVTPLVDAYIRDKQYEKALQYSLGVLQKNPNDYAFIQKTAFIYGDLGNRKEEQKYLNQAIRLHPKDPEMRYWLAETQFADGHKKEARHTFATALDLFDAKQELSPEEERMVLKSRGRVRWTQSLDKDYQMAIQENPNDSNLAGDYVGFLMEQREAKKAIPVLKKLSAKDPKQKAFHHDLGDAYLLTGEWQNGMKEYELAGANKTLKHLHNIYDHRVKGIFRLTDFGAEEFNEYGASYNGYLSNDLELKAESIVGVFTSPSSNYQGDAEYGKVQLGLHHDENWIFNGGLGYGFSDMRKTVSPFADVTYQISDLFSLTTGLQYRQLRADLPQAISAGDLEDTGKLNFGWQPWDRVHITGKYEFVRDYLPNGPKAYENTIEPAVSFVIFKKPYFTIGYQYTFIQIFDTDNFLAIVPLIYKMRANYATTYFNYQIVDNFLFEASGFLGDDSARGLEFVKGELWGARAGATWNINSWCDLEASYDYGREFLFNVPGRYQQVVVGLSGHWF